MIAAVLGAGVLSAGASEIWATASDAPVREVVTGQVLRLVSVQDPAAMGAMDPGEAVTWDVQVSANRPDGEIDLSLNGTGPDGVFQMQVAACTGEGAGCTEQLLAPTVVGAGTVEVGTQSAAEEVWYRITTELVAPDQGATTVLTFTADGHGEDVSAGDPGAPRGDPGLDLPPTGVLAPVLALALTGVLLLGGTALRRASRAGARRQAGPS
ncbi:hypothetical protein [Ruania alba]|nr:hypothetical protein [Ruania alba]